MGDQDVLSSFYKCIFLVFHFFALVSGLSLGMTINHKQMGFEEKKRKLAKKRKKRKERTNIEIRESERKQENENRKLEPRTLTYKRSLDETIFLFLFSAPFCIMKQEMVNSKRKKKT